MLLSDWKSLKYDKLFLKPGYDKLSSIVQMRTLIIYLMFQNLTMLGERALDLVREAKRSQDVLGPYNEDKVNKA